MEGRDLRLFPTPKSSGSHMGPTGTGESSCGAKQCALDRGTTTPPPEACLSHQFGGAPYGNLGAHTPFTFFPSESRKQCGTFSRTLESLVPVCVPKPTPHLRSRCPCSNRGIAAHPHSQSSPHLFIW